jgi:hypothetical protein
LDSALARAGPPLFPSSRITSLKVFLSIGAILAQTMTDKM